MKEIWVILLLTVFSPNQSDEITSEDLIGKWEIVNTRITNPLYCGTWDSEPILDSIMEFTNDRLLIFTSKDGNERTKPTKTISWELKNNNISITSDNKLSPQISVITRRENTYFLQITNMVEIRMRKK